MDAVRAPRRVGFSLIELLVVMSILVLLAALAVGTYFRVKKAQSDTATERIMVRLTTGLERLTKATLDQARQDVREDRPTAAVALRMSQTWTPSAAAPNNQPGDPDRDREASILAYLRLKAELPQTFDEAALGVVWHPPDSLNGVPLTPLVSIPGVGPKPGLRTLVGHQPLPPTGPGPPPLGRWRVLITAGQNPTQPTERDYAMEAAVLLYHILSERGVRGELPGDEIGGAQVGTVEPHWRWSNDPAGTDNGVYPEPLKVFRDVYGNPISFVRFATNAGDIGTINPNGGAPTDPLDPQGRLRATLGGAAPGWGDGPPNANPPNVFRLGFFDALRYQPETTPTNAYTFPAGYFPSTGNGQRWLTTLVSQGSTRDNFDALNRSLDRSVRDPANLTVLVDLPVGTSYLYSYQAR